MSTKPIELETPATEALPANRKSILIVSAQLKRDHPTISFPERFALQVLLPTDGL
jgi:hypothetical protein